MLNPKDFIGSETSSPKITLALATIATLLVSGTGVYTLQQFQSAKSQDAQDTVNTTPKVSLVTALGRLEPQGEVIKLSAPTSSESSRVERLLVKEGDRVKAGEVVAILDNRDRLQAALAEAQEQVKVAQAKLLRVKAGVKQGEIAAQKAVIARIQTERENQIVAQTANITRLKVEGFETRAAQQATIARIETEREQAIAAQKATIARLNAELGNAQTEYQRYQMLYQEGVISASARDSKRLTLEATQQQLKEAQSNLNRITLGQQQQLKEAQANLNRITLGQQQQLKEAQANLNRIASGGKEQLAEAKATLEQISEVRPVDVQIATAELSQAIASVNKAQANLEQAYVRSPHNAQVLKIYTRPGEIITTEGIAQLGETSQMYAVAEVYESEITQVQVGQKVKVTSDSVTEELQGTVEQIGLQVKKQNVINTDPSANIDARVVEVKVRLDPESSQKVTGLTNMQVKVEISL